MNLYILTNPDYKNLNDVSFFSEATVEQLKSVLTNNTMTLPNLLKSLNELGCKSYTNKK